MKDEDDGSKMAGLITIFNSLSDDRRRVTRDDYFDHRRTGIGPYLAMQTALAKELGITFEVVDPETMNGAEEYDEILAGNEIYEALKGG